MRGPAHGAGGNDLTTKGHIMGRIAPCLWFDGRAEEAMNFYASIFKRAKIGRTMRWGDANPEKKGQALTVTFELDGQEFVGLNGGPQYHFTPAISLFVRCETQEEIDDYWNKLLDGGTAVQCGWLTDKFGVSWQIAPTVLFDMLRDEDRARADRVMRAMMQMVKLEIKPLREAYDWAQ
jgi:predicted 3-demethylubiquinone-9 3-methyltransferase (glyoxalase superfamily)